MRRRRRVDGAGRLRLALGLIDGGVGRGIDDHVGAALRDDRVHGAGSMRCRPARGRRCGPPSPRAGQLAQACGDLAVAADHQDGSRTSLIPECCWSRCHDLQPTGSGGGWRRRDPGARRRSARAQAAATRLDGPDTSDGLAQAGLEGLRRRPAELALDLGRVDGVAAVVAGPVGDEA